MPDEDAVVPQPKSVAAAFATDAHQGGNAHLAGKRARDEQGRLLSSDPIYFPVAEVGDLVRFMQLHEVLGVTDPYCQLPKTMQ